jgi:uncharacterized membrane protein YkoI
MRTIHRLLLALSILSSAPAWADIGRDQAAAIARQQADGRVLSVERVDAGRRAVWRVKVLTSRGEVRVIFVDAATGRPG